MSTTKVRQDNVLRLKLAAARLDVETLDHEIIALLDARRSASHRIADIKAGLGMPRVDLQQESSVRGRYAAVLGAEHGYPLATEILAHSKA